MCGKGFTMKKNLKRHVEIHLKESGAENHGQNDGPIENIYDESDVEVPENLKQDDAGFHGPKEADPEIGDDTARNDSIHYFNKDSAVEESGMANREQDDAGQ